MLMLTLCLALLSVLAPGVRAQTTQKTGSAQKDTHGLFNVYFIPAYRVATNRTLKPPPPNLGIVFRSGLVGPASRPTTTTTERPRISGAASDIQQQSLPQTAQPQQPALPLRTQASAITQYLLGFRNGYQQYQQSNGYQQPQQYNPIPPGYYPYPTRSTQGQQFQAYYPFPPVYIPPSIIPKSATVPPPLPEINLNTGNNYRAAASSKDESIIRSAQISVTPTLATAGPIYATAADDIQTTIEPAANSTVSDVTVTATEEASTTKTKSTTVLPETTKTSAALTSEPTPPTNSTSDSKTSPASAQEARTSPSPDSKPKTPESSSTEKAQAEEHRSISRHFEFSEDKEHSQVNATGDIRLTATRKTSMEGEASQKSPPSPAAQGLSPAFPTFPSLPLNTPHPHSHPHPAIIQGPNGFFVGSYNPSNQIGVIPPPSNNDPYNAYSPFGHSAALNQGGFPGGHPTSALNQGGFPGGHPSSALNQGGFPVHPTSALNQGGFPVHPTLPARYEDLYYGFAPGYPFGVAPPNNATAQTNNAPPRQQAQPAQQQGLPPNQPLPVYHPGPPRQFFDVAGPRQLPYSLPQQVPYPGYNQPYQPPTGDYSRFSNDVLQSPGGRPFYAGDPALPNRGYAEETGGLPPRIYSNIPGVPPRLYPGDPSAGTSANTALPNRLYAGDPSGGTANQGLPNRLYPVDPSGSSANTGLPNRLYSGDPSGPSAPSRLYNADPGSLNGDPLLNRGFGGPPPFLAPAFARSDSAEANSGQTNFVNSVRGVGTAYEVKPGSENIVDNYDRRASRRDSIEADGDSEQVVY